MVVNINLLARSECANDITLFDVRLDRSGRTSIRVCERLDFPYPIHSSDSLVLQPVTPIFN